MRDYVILTDSCCDLSAEMAAELGVEVLPLSLQMGDRTYRNYLDGREIGFHEFYERVRSGELATTSAVISFRLRSYSNSPGRQPSRVAVTAVPSISALINTFTI